MWLAGRARFGEASLSRRSSCTLENMRELDLRMQSAMSHIEALRAPLVPPDAVQLRTLKSMLPTWSDELEVLYRRWNGSARAEILPPSDWLLSAEEVGRAWSQECRIYGALFDDEVMLRVDALEAGAPTDVWVRSFVPISSDGLGDLWAVDLREGPAQGLVIRWMRESGGMQLGSPTYGSLADLLLEARPLE